MEFNDWSAHMQQVELHTKRIEHKLLHKDYNGMGTHIDAIKTALDKTQAWVAMQGQNANVDVVPVIQRVLDAIPEKDFSRPYLMVAIQEIQQLRGERQFWLQSGYDIGSNVEEVARLVEDMGAEGFGTLAIAATIRQNAKQK